MRRVRKVKGISSYKTNFNSLQPKENESRPEPIKKPETDLQDFKTSKKINEREVEDIKEEKKYNKSTRVVKSKKPRTLKQIMKSFDEADDVEEWLRDNSDLVLNLKPKDQKKFIDYIKNIYF